MAIPPPARRMAPPGRSIKSRIIAVFVLLFLSVFFLAGTSTAFLLYKQTYDHTLEEFRFLSGNIANQVAWLMDKQIQSAQTFVRSAPARKLAVNGSNEKRATAEIVGLLRLIYGNPPAVFIYSKTDTLLFSNDPAMSGDIAKIRQTAVDSVVTYNHHGHFLLILPLAVPDESGSPTGTKAYFLIDMGIFKDLIQTYRIGRTGHANLVSGDGQIIACPIYPVMSHKVSQNVVQKIFSSDAGALEAGDDGHGNAASLIGHAKVNFSAKQGITGALNWAVFYRQQESEIFGSLWELSVKFLLIFTLTLSLFAYIFYNFLARLFKPLAELEASLQGFQDGSRLKSMPIRSNDEIGSLVAAFNKLSSAIETKENSIKEEERFKSLEKCLIELSDMLRNPLASLVIASQLLSEKFNDISNADKSTLTSVLKHDADTLAAYFDDFLYVAQMPRPATVTACLEYFLGEHVANWIERIFHQKPPLKIKGSHQMAFDPAQMDHAVKHLLLFMRKGDIHLGNILIKGEKNGAGLLILLLLSPLADMERLVENLGDGGSLHFILAQKIIKNHGGSLAMNATDEACGFAITFPG